MEELIIDYIFELCEVKGGITVFFDGRKAYYDVLKKHLGDLFDLNEWEVDGYMITCFHDMDKDFSYSHFMAFVKPKPSLNGRVYLDYLDYVYANDVINVVPNEISRFSRYVGIDPALGCDNIVITAVFTP